MALAHLNQLPSNLKVYTYLYFKTVQNWKIARSLTNSNFQQKNGTVAGGCELKTNGLT